MEMLSIVFVFFLFWEFVGDWSFEYLLFGFISSVGGLDSWEDLDSWDRDSWDKDSWDLDS